MNVTTEIKGRFTEHYLAMNGYEPDMRDPLTQSVASAFMAGALTGLEPTKAVVVTLLPDRGFPSVLVNGTAIDFDEGIFNEATTVCAILEAAGIGCVCSEEFAETVCEYLRNNVEESK